MALDNVRLGLTLDDKFRVSGIFRAMPTKALEQIAFASEGLELDHVLQFLMPEYYLKNEDGPVAQCYVEAQKKFFEETLPRVLREKYQNEKGNEESYSKDARHQKDFLSVSFSSLLCVSFCFTHQNLTRISRSVPTLTLSILPMLFSQLFVKYCTGSPFLCHPDIKTDDDMIKVEFNPAEMSEDCLPEAHTCVKTLKFPLFVYGNNADTLRSKLCTAIEWGGFGQA